MGPIVLVEADGARSPFPNNYFASGFSNSVLEHIPHIDVVLAETARVLKPGAPFYFCVPNTRYLSELSISRVLGKGYTEWFRKISRRLTCGRSKYLADAFGEGRL